MGVSVGPESNGASNLSRRNDSITAPTLHDNEHVRFIQVVENAMENLMVRNGYSRERATKTIVHAITRSVSPSAVSVTDEQVFDVMRRYHLGTEQALRALAVSSTLDLLMTEKGLSSANAVSELTHYIQKAKLSSSDPYESSSDESESSALIDRPVQITFPEQKQSISKTLSSQSARRRGRQDTKASSVRKGNTSTDYVGNNKKLTIAEQGNRERSDSAVEEVTAKLNGESSISNKTNVVVKSLDNGNAVAVAIPGTTTNKSVLSPPLGGRTKRSRAIGGEDSDNDLVPGSGSGTKRSRA